MIFDDNYLNSIYLEFKKDFLNKNFTRTEILKKYDISQNKYNKLRIQVCTECSIEHKPFGRGETRIITDNSYIYPLRNKFRISKTINKRTVDFGLYDDYDIAKKVRDKLIGCKWDKKELKNILKEIKEQ